ncbi:MAG: phosphoribosylformylglycinamidine cyclo-ligase [Acidimicrobiia bacterium]|nr:phosphoribosylformylglycinamidine cyclo-ligase [Acidimicrobiia bacterium]
MTGSTSYRDAGVDLDAADAVVQRIKPAVTGTWHDGVVGGFGGFAAGITIPAGYDNPVLMMSTDGVGTKAEIARRAGKFEGLGWDLVAMCIDDLVAAGARPIAMTDYVAVGQIDIDMVSTIVTSIAAACAEAGVALLGGETAEHPGVMDADAFDVAGAALGVVEHGREIDGSRVRPGNVVIGIESPNLRSNGFSLVRKVVLDSLDLDDELPGTGRAVADVLLEPSLIYTPAVLALINATEVRSAAHVTGGGLPGNVPRVLPDDCDALIDTSTWEPPPVFRAIAELSGGHVDDLYRTFNMGIGFVAIVATDAAQTAINTLAGNGRRARVIGEVVSGTGAAILH